MAAAESRYNDQKIQKLLSPLMEDEKHPDDYLPKVVSIGPYFHGRRQLALVQNFKSTAVDLFVAGGFPSRNRKYYLDKVLDITGEIRGCYEKLQQPFSNYHLSRMMLEDASLIIVYMEMMTTEARDRETSWRGDPSNFAVMKKQLGMLTVATLPRDFLLLQNQIPLRVINLLITLRYGPGKDQILIHRFLNKILFRRDENRQRKTCTVDTWEPLHLLEASYRLVTSDFKRPRTPRASFLNFFCNRRKSNSDSELPPHPTTEIRKPFYSFRTARDLKATGIRFKPSPNQSLKDVSFTSYFFFATLRLPTWAISAHTKVLLKNMVAYELSPNSPTHGEVLSYINLMNALIDGPEDVKVLRKKRILSNTLSSDEDAADFYNDFNTYGLDNYKFFGPVKQQIQDHCRSRINVWIAELLHCYFRSPWSITAFFAAISVLALSAAQLYYTLHPPRH